MLDRKKVADLRLALIRANMQKTADSLAEKELQVTIRPLYGELLALTDAALKIRAVCQQPQTGRTPDGSRLAIVRVVASAMHDLDDLEGQSHV